MIDRSIVPQIQPVDNLILPMPRRYELDNQIPVYEINMGNQQVIKLELIFKAGRWHEKEKLVARACSQLLRTGTLKHNAHEMAHFFEYYGASLGIYDGFNTSNIQLYCLSKHLERLLPMLQELLTEPAFAQDELQKFVTLNQQNLKVQLQKNDLVAYRVFTESIYGSSHPYGYNSTEATYDSLDRSNLVEHFNNCYKSNHCNIIISGKTPANCRQLLNRFFGQLEQGQLPDLDYPLMPPVERQVLHQVLDPSSLQASIRIGRRLFNRAHPDCHQFYMTNMILGGYFGARLMQNLREKNGYTYGAYASIETLMHSGYWYVHTDVGKDVAEFAIQEIYTEIERLQDRPVHQDELDIVKNYTMGMQLTSIDGVFNVSSLLKSLITAQLDEQFFYEFIDTIKNIEPSHIQAMAQKYLDPNKLTEVVVL